MHWTLVAIVVAGLLPGTLRAQEKVLAEKYDQPLGTCFEELKYPYPTAYLNLFVEGQDLRMCFMDVQPTKNPNGRSIVLERQQGANAGGYSGLEDGVDNHWAELFKAALLSTILGGVFFLEAVSVVVQVSSFKLTGRRIFLMAPIHHHFEKKGWPEPRIIVRFWIISILLALVALASMKVR